jgi:dTDP-4-dehydrorhamnose reductase
MEKLFIFGIGGLTGSKLATIGKEDYEIFGSYNIRNPKFNFSRSEKLNITNFEKVKSIILKIKPDIVINASALNSVDYCENHQNEAKKINIDFVQELYKISKSENFKLVQLSTDSIFDGTKKNPYVENDKSNPMNVYGKTKLLGEKIILGNSQNLVVRASVLYGWIPKSLSSLDSSSMKPTNFGQWLINKLELKETVNIITDEESSPIIADDFAKSIIYLIKNNKNGIFHSAPPIQISRYEFSIKLAKILDLDSELIQPTTNLELGRNVVTGFNKCLDSSKMLKETNFQFLSLEKSLKILKNQFLENE